MSHFWVGHIAALALVVLDVVVRGWRLQLLIPGGARPSLWRSVTVNAYGDAASAITPARIGGDPLRFVGLRRSNVDTATALVALGAEQAIDWALMLLGSVLLAAAFGGGAARAAGDILDRLTTAAILPWLAIALVLAVASGLVAHWYRRRHPTVLRHSLRRAIASIRALAVRSIIAAALLTAVSMAARIAILPVLFLPLSPEANLGPVTLGSFALLYGQLFLPTPSGVGGVEVGFVAGFAGSLPAAQLATLLLAWRGYTVVFDVLFGGALFVRSALSRRTADSQSVLPFVSRR